MPPQPPEASGRRRANAIIGATAELWSADARAVAQELISSFPNDTSLEPRRAEILRADLARFPASLFTRYPDLHYLFGRIHDAAGESNRALQRLEEAGLGFAAQGLSAYHAACWLWVARLHHRLEDLDAARYYTQEAETLLRSHQDNAHEIMAHLHLGLARLGPDVGRLRQSLTHAQTALHFYENVPDFHGQFQALMLQAHIRRQMGLYPQADTLLQIARRRAQLGNLGDLAELQVINAEAHAAWYRGDLDRAAERARTGVELADRHPHSKQRVYLRLVLANVLRGQGRHAQARAAYTATAEVVAATDYDGFRPWVIANASWLDVLEGDLIRARRQLIGLMQIGERGQVASFSVFLAAVYSLNGRHRQARSLFRSALNHYEDTHDPLSVCAIRCHLAYIALQQGRHNELQQLLNAAFGWMEEQRLTYFPHWWHPAIMAELAAHALLEDWHTLLAERIFLRFPQEGARVLLTLSGSLTAQADQEARNRIDDVLRNLAMDPLDILQHTANDAVREVLQRLISMGKLNPTRLAHLTDRLMTASVRRKPNPVIVAVFGLYTDGASRSAIAVEVGMSVKTVGNYITAIYESFEIGADLPRNDRRARLRELAIQEGYLGPG